jgi:M6 family metalloprotease-like protein
MKMRAMIGVAMLAALVGVPVWAQSPESLVMIDRLQHLQFDRLGNPQIKTDAIPPVRSTVDRPHRMLIVPVEFADVGFERYKGEPAAAEKNRVYFQNLLFSPTLRAPREGTLTHYYYHQSKGRYIVTGQVLPIVKAPEPLEFYGKPIQNSDGQWRNDMRADTLVEQVMKAAYARNPSFAWKDFDVFDPQDYDGDKVYEEPDGYIDHLVLVYAGKAQSSCQRQFSLDQKFVESAPATLYDTLQDAERECARRIWPHRGALPANNGKGPTVEGFANRRGGVPVTNALWAYDYNMQSEYTDISTFIHEFGHSIGLPDIYARQTSNSTASWEAMSSTAAPQPQELSAWSRMVLGWLEPCVITPRIAGGSRVQSVYLKTMNEWTTAGEKNAAGLCDAAMVILPPKIRQLRMGPLATNNGRQAAYTGQGNDMQHYLSRRFDFRTVTANPTLELDAWFDIEADWDYLYVEASLDGTTYQRLLPTDKSAIDDTDSVMPSKRGHDGLGTTPGFTGRSGDRNGDGRVESAPGCDVTAARQTAEERVRAGSGPDPCEKPQWVHATFDLGAFRGKEVEIRFHYFTDGAAVEDGALIDNVAVPAVNFSDTFEADHFEGWSVEGFSLSSGTHDILVPHFYLLEYRDPYATFARAKNYDSALAEPGFTFFRNAETQALEAVDIRYRPGVLTWYYNGEFPWSENDPATSGTGNGFLLLVDSTPQEFQIPLAPSQYFKEADGWRWWNFDAGAQTPLRQAFLDVMCFQRRPAYYPLDLTATDRAACGSTTPAGESGRYENRQLLYGFMLANEFLPGEPRQARKSMGTLYDIRLANGTTSFRLNDALIRNRHSADAPFALTPFADGMRFSKIGANGEMTRVRGVDFAPVSTFSDAQPSRYLNPHLPFGSAKVPSEGLNFQLAEPGAEAPAGAKVKIYFTWDR